MTAIARATTLILSPAASVFNSFVQPALLKKFWLKQASGRLGEGAKVDWEFRVPGATETVEVTRFIEGEQISFVFSDGKTVAMRFHAKGRSPATVDVQVKGFKGRKAVAEAVSTTKSFAIFRCDLKPSGDRQVRWHGAGQSGAHRRWHQSVISDGVGWGQHSNGRSARGSCWSGTDCRCPRCHCNYPVLSRLDPLSRWRERIRVRVGSFRAPGAAVAGRNFGRYPANPSRSIALPFQ